RRSRSFGGRPDETSRAPNGTPGRATLRRAKTYIDPRTALGAGGSEVQIPRPGRDFDGAISLLKPAEIRLSTIEAGPRRSHQFFHKLPRRLRRHPHLALRHRHVVGQDGLGAVEAGQIGALEELADGDFVAPELGPLHGLVPVGSIIGGIVFELPDARAEPLI